MNLEKIMRARLKRNAIMGGLRRWHRCMLLIGYVWGVHFFGDVLCVKLQAAPLTTAVSIKNQTKLLRISIPFHEKPKAIHQRTPESLVVTFEKSLSLDLREAQKFLPEGMILTAANDNQSTVVTMIAPRGKKLRIATYFQGSSYVFDVFKDIQSANQDKKSLKKEAKQSTAAVSSPSQKSSKDATKALSAPSGTSNGPVPFSLRTEDLERTITVMLVADKPFPVAVYRRGANIWIVYRKDEAVLKAMPKTKWKEKIHLHDQDKSLVALRIHDSQYPVVFATGHGDGLAIQLSSWARSPRVPIAVDRTTCQGESCLTLGMRTQKVEAWRDPILGDTLRLGLTALAGHGVADRLQTSDVQILATAQGVAIKPHAKDLKVTASSDQDMTLTRPGGLLLAAPEASPQHVWAEGAFFNWNHWATQTTWNPQTHPTQPGFQKAKDIETHIKGMKYLLAHDQASEVCRTIDHWHRDHPAMRHQAELHALKGAACYRAGRLEMAEQAFAFPELAASHEIKMWQAALAARKGAWHRAGGLMSQPGLVTLKDYPAEVYQELAPYMCEAALIRHDENSAAALLLGLRSRTSTHPQSLEQRVLLEGWLTLLKKKFQEVSPILQGLSNSQTKDIAITARVLFAHAQKEIRNISGDELAAKLEEQKFSWRKSRFESYFLMLLAQTYQHLQKWREALAAFDDAYKRTADIEEKNAIHAEAAEIMESLFAQPANKSTDVLRDLALFSEFKIFVPRNAKGDAIILALCDRLQKVDLLDDAIRLLDYLRHARASGVTQSKLTTRVAWLHLLNDQPEKALKVIDVAKKSPSADVSQSNRFSDDDKDRLYLKVQALISLGRCSLALELLADDSSMTANNLRVDCYWQSREWAKAADLLSQQLKNFAPPPEENPDDVGLSKAPDAEGQASPTQAPSPDLLLRAAVALCLAGRDAEVKELGKQYSTFMAATPLRETFTLLTTADDALRIDRMSDIPGFLTTTQKASLFMDEYRARIDLRDSSALHAHEESKSNVGRDAVKKSDKISILAK